MAKTPEAKNTGSTDREILDRAKCTIEIAGKEYEWTEVGRRQAREMLGEMIPIITGFVEHQDKPDRLLGLLNESLEFFFRWHGRMKADRKAIEDNGTNEQITAALMAIRGVIDCPFQRDLAEARRASEATVTPSPESSN